MKTRCCGIFAAAFFFLTSLEGADRSVNPILSRIPRAPVASSALTTVGYSTKLHALEIEFHDGSVYRYLEVPRSVHRELIAAESKAGYYNRYVRGKYRSLRVKSRRTR